jgi:hypothetical protein
MRVIVVAWMKAAVVLAALLLSGSPARGVMQGPVPTAFTYQGALTSAGTPYVGSFDLRVTLHADASTPVELGSLTVLGQTTDAEGRFAATLDFAIVPPPGAYLQLNVRTPADPTDTLPFEALSPRQAVLPTPQAMLAEQANSAVDAAALGGFAPASYRDASLLSAGTLPSARLSGSYGNALILTNAGNSFTGSGSGLTGLNASNLSFGTVPPARIAGSFTNAVTFSNPSNSFGGSGLNLTNLNAANISTGTLSPARGGTGSSITLTTVGNVLKWNGTAFTPQADSDTVYTAGSGLALAGTVFSIPPDGVTSGMIADGTIDAFDFGTNVVNASAIASESASLAKVSGGALRTDGTSVGIGSVMPETALHIQTVEPTLRVQSTINGGSAQLDLVETVTGLPSGARLYYNGTGNALQIGTYSNGANIVTALTINRGSTDATFAGDVAAQSFSIPSTTRSLMLPAAAFVPGSSSNSYFLDASGLQNTSGAGNQVSFYAPVSVPDGAVIRGFTFRCLDNDGTVDMTVELQACTLATGNVSTFGSTTTTGGSASLRTFSSPALAANASHAATSHTIRATWAGPLPTASVMRLVSVRVDYTINAPLP